MKNKVLFGLATLAIVAMLSSCGKVPQAEIDAVNVAIAAAQAAEANVYLPDEFAAVQDSMNAITATIEVQKSKLFRNFGTAKEQLAATLAQANQLAANVAGKKEEVRKEAEGIIAAIKSVTEENARLVVKLPRGKEGAAVIEAIKADIATIDSSVAEAQGLFDKGAFMDALNKVKAAQEKATSINAEIKAVLTKARIRF